MVQSLYKLLLEDIEVTDSKTITNAFNDFFLNIGPHLSPLIPIISNLPLTYMPNTQYDDLLQHQVSAEELSNIISKLNPSKSTGPFSIPFKILITLKDFIIKPLQAIFNQSFSNGRVHEKFKIANVVPVFKQGSELSVNNYRLISLFLFSKEY